MSDDLNANQPEKAEEKKLSAKSKKGNEAKRLNEKIEDLENQLKRAVADYRNLEKRIAEEKESTVKFANKELLTKLIPAFDTLFLASKYIEDEGIEITIKSLHDVLKEAGVTRVETEGKVFNPEEMEAVMTEKGEENKVIEELRPGYILNGRLIRPAQVKVGKEQ